MNFAEKLRLLMDIQGISASRLSKEIKVDASLVSRWRSGIRIPPQNSNHFTNISNYFAHSANMDYQKIALLEIMNASYDLKNESADLFAELLKNWLNEQDTAENAVGINNFLGKMQMFGKNSISKLPELDTELPTGIPQNIEAFYGIEGIQKAVLKLLTMTAMQDTPRTLLLFSDQNINWLTKDKAFAAKWANLMITCLSKGNSIRIIHNPSRDLSEMFEAIEKWLPVYMTGHIEPYYCPKYHESLFKHTVFIAPDLCAVQSHIVAGQEQKAEYLFTLDKSRINNLTQFYNAYLEQCHPLLKIYTGKNIQKLPPVGLELEEQKSNAFLLLPSFSVFSMSEALFEQILNRADIDVSSKNLILKQFQKQKQAFLDNLKHYAYTEIVLPLATELFLYGNYRINTYPFMNLGELYYNNAEYKEHLKNIVDLLKKYRNYSITILKYNAIPNIQVIAKENIGMIFGKTNAPCSFFAVNQINICTSFYNYMEKIAENMKKQEKDKKHLIEQLQSSMQHIL
ncbi:MAG: hypothetical protein PHN47_01470 [Clostridia bacterium]|nr:hypothetical protein [Clostridia bacterium]